MAVRFKKDELAYRRIGDEYFVLTLADNTIHRITGAGVRIMELLEEGKDEGEVTSILVAEFDAPAEEVAADVRAFLEELAAKGIVVLNGQ